VDTNLAYHLDSKTTDGFVRAMASSLDLINIWSIFLLGIGFARTTKVGSTTSLFRRISHGATRLQEVLADRTAAGLYGAQAFEEGLRHVVRRQIEFRYIAGMELQKARGREGPSETSTLCTYTERIQGKERSTWQ
jgi:hypothetical protein